jgi:hypothetical protein
VSYVPLGVIGARPALNFNSTADQAVPIQFPPGYTKYVVTGMVAYNPSTSLTTAAGGLYNATSKPAGGILVAAAQVYTALTAAGKFLSATLAALAGTDIQTATILYLSLTIAQGVAATADVAILGYFLP